MKHTKCYMYTIQRVFSDVQVCVTQTSIKMQNINITLEISFMPHLSTPVPLSQGQALLRFFPPKISFPCPRASYKWNQRACMTLYLTTFVQHRIFEMYPRG